MRLDHRNRGRERGRDIALRRAECRRDDEHRYRERRQFPVEQVEIPVGHPQAQHDQQHRQTRQSRQHDCAHDNGGDQQIKPQRARQSERKPGHKRKRRERVARQRSRFYPGQLSDRLVALLARPQRFYAVRVGMFVDGFASAIPDRRSGLLEVRGEDQSTLPEQSTHRQHDCQEGYPA